MWEFLCIANSAWLRHILVQPGSGQGTVRVCFLRALFLFEPGILLLFTRFSGSGTWSNFKFYFVGNHSAQNYSINCGFFSHSTFYIARLSFLTYRSLWGTPPLPSSQVRPACSVLFLEYRGTSQTFVSSLSDLAICSSGTVLFLCCPGNGPLFNGGVIVVLSWKRAVI